MSTLRYISLSCLLLASCVAAESNLEWPDSGGTEDYASRRTAWERIDEARADYRRTPDGSGELAAELAGDATLEQLLDFARAHNPGLEAAFQHWRAALERVPQASALPDPRLTLGAYLAEVETRVGPMQARIGVAQPLPWFGELGRRGDVAFEASEAAREMLEVARLTLDGRVRTAWYEMAWVEQAAAITGGNLELLSHWESVARARLETGPRQLRGCHSRAGRTGQNRGPNAKPEGLAPSTGRAAERSARATERRGAASAGAPAVRSSGG